MTIPSMTLADYGWTQFFQSQLGLDDLSSVLPVRVLAVHRGALEVAHPDFHGRIAPPDGEGENRATAGDWVLIDAATHVARRVLRRTSLFKRLAAGTGRTTQLMAANVDTLFVVSSCNQDFNPARLERYLAIAHEAGVTPVVVLTKADLADAADYAAAAAGLLAGLVVETLDARDPAAAERLAPWCAPGQTVALAGSSGVGKSTLVNTLAGTVQAVRGIRDDDARGRHTTTGRSLHRLPAGGWIMDTPGMRELGLADAEAGLADVFAEIAALAADCRFADCAHDGEPGCAVQAAVKAGTLDPDRLRRWRKLLAEERRNSKSLAERKADSRAFGRMVKGVMQAKRSRYEL